MRKEAGGTGRSMQERRVAWRTSKADDASHAWNMLINAEITAFARPWYSRCLLATHFAQLR